MKFTKCLTSLAIITLLAACSWSKPYKMPVQQGNYVTPDMANQLKVGMSKTQVKYILGSPLLDNYFQNNHWHYVYQNNPQTGHIETKNLEVVFKGDKVQKIHRVG